MEMSDRFSSSPYRRHRNDVEASLSEEYEDGPSSSPFVIYRTKDAPVNRLKRWRQAALVLNASRRFRYTLDLKKEEENKQTLRKIRAHVEAIRAANRFKEAGQKVEVSGTPRLPTTSAGDYGIDPQQLATMTRDQDFSALEECGGVKGLADMLKTNVEKGIHGDDDDLLKRKDAFGSNTYPRKKGRGFWNFVWDACQDTTLIILIVAAAASLGLGIKSEGIKEGWNDGGSIAIAVFIVIVVTAASDYKQSLQFQNLNDENKNIHLEVIRGGRRLGVSIFDIVVGDVVPLKIGDQVPADGVLIAGHILAIDESSMTGESKIVNKGSKSPFLMSGCKVADGYGTMLVASVGVNTKWGLLMASISEDSETTPFQVWLNGVATSIGVIGFSIAVVVLVVLLIGYFSGHTKGSDGTVQFIAGETKFITAVDAVIKIFTVAVALMVLAVPDGLPLAHTLMLSYSMRKIMADNALVRRLSACETMGSATDICVDTGMLTLNQMKVVRAYIGGKEIDSIDHVSGLPPMVKSLLIEGIAQNTTGSVFVTEDDGNVEVSGSPTEKAILEWGVNLGMNFDAIRSNSSIIQLFPFNLEKKRGGVALKLPDSEVHIHWKGDAETVLASCTRYIDTNDNFIPMDDDKVALFKTAIEAMAARTLHCVSIAYRSYKMDSVPINEDELAHWKIPENDLVLLAIVGLKNPCRPDVKEAVQLCQIAGVKVRLVSSDSLLKAGAIAFECGILPSGANDLELTEGMTFGALSEVRRRQFLKDITVMARSSTSDKCLLVQDLMKRGHIVAVTGDSTNDAVALHEAHIGLAMGIQGTEVAKESSDIIVLDDNFASVVKVVRWGRSIYANIQKLIQFQLTVTITALVVDFVCAVSSIGVPWNAVQILWINLVMDTLGALALATEPPTYCPMRRPPVKRSEPFITNIMWRNILIQVVYQVIILLVINFQGEIFLNLYIATSEDAAGKLNNALTQNVFVFLQIFNGFNCRKADEINVFKGITRNRLFMVVVGLTLVLQVIIIEFLYKFTSSVRLNWRLWLLSIGIGFISLPVAAIGKLIPVPVTPISECFAMPYLHAARMSNH